MESYFIGDKHYAFSYFMGLQFDKLMCTVAYSGAHNLSGEGSQVQVLSFWGIGGWAERALLRVRYPDILLRLFLLNIRILYPSKPTFQNITLHGNNWGWLTVAIHTKCKPDEVSELCEIAPPCPSHWDDLYAWLVDCVTPDLKYVSCYFQSSHKGSELSQHGTNLPWKWKPHINSTLSPLPTVLRNPLPTEADSSETASWAELSLSVCKKWSWNKPCLQTQEEALTGHVVIFCQD